MPDPSLFRGTNYTPSISRGFVTNLGLIPWVEGAGRVPMSGGGFFTERHCRQEIAEIAGRGMNSIRVVGSFYGWLADRQLYLDSLATLARVCVQHGVTITYILWNSTPWGSGTGAWSPIIPLASATPPFPDTPTNGAVLRAMFNDADNWAGAVLARNSLHDENLTQYTEPGPDSLLWDYGPGYQAWDPRFLNLVDKYLQAICQFFRTAVGRRALGSLELYNEPDAIFSGGYENRMPKVFEFIRYVYDRVRALSGGALCAIGWAGVGDDAGQSWNAIIEEEYGVMQDYYSFHSYHNPTDLFRVLGEVRDQMPRSLPMVCSEFWFSRFRGELAQCLNAVGSQGMGGYIWGVLQHNSFEVREVQGRLQLTGRDYDGVLAPQPALSILPDTDIILTPLNKKDERALSSW